MTGPAGCWIWGAAPANSPFPLAAHVSEAVGLDPEPDMLSEAHRQASDQGVTNVQWVRGSSADLPGNLGHFQLVTMGRCFHWMDREHVLTALGEMVDEQGALAIVNDSNLNLPSTPWQQAIADTQRRFLAPGHRHGSAPAASHGPPHERVLATSPFRHVKREVHQYQRTWTIEETIGYLYSTSLPLRRLLGARRTAFEEALTTALLSIDPIGQFTEPVALEVLTATRD
ncbi:class I SAM-dependent methyltransferase [Mycobacterium sp. pW049]|uniref:class I SAM-dependent methyltransferase n=1 Tax=[Mycobacterium] bulgaricum TaxID=3238985 RepID=UPI00351ACFF8